MIKLFVVREEGGGYHDGLSYREWCAEVDGGVPIFGIKIGDTRIVHDRIVARQGYQPVRMNSSSGSWWIAA